MAKKLRLLIITDQPEIFSDFIKTISVNKICGLWDVSSGWVSGHGLIKPSVKVSSKNTKKLDSIDYLSLSLEKIYSENPLLITKNYTQAIVAVADQKLATQIKDVLRTVIPFKLPILKIGSKEKKVSFSQELRLVPWRDIVSKSIKTESRWLKIQGLVKSLKNFVASSESIAILLQNDPDPDGIASALAFRKLLGRNSQTSMILSYGKITRPENVAMVKLLDIEVVQVLPEALKLFDKVVMIDCQPSFFGSSCPSKVDVIIDHHPFASHKVLDNCTYPIIREDLGATSTLLTQMFQAAELPINQRLATALLYGIKSDTLALNREVSEDDLDAFLYLYKLVNTNTLKKIERPELSKGFLQKLHFSLGNIHSDENLRGLFLGEVSKEEWISQAADFALQFEGCLWSVGFGVFEDCLHISGRNCGYIQHCGDIFKSAFSKYGSAGGHRSLAKAVLPAKSILPHIKDLSSGEEIFDFILNCLNLAVENKHNSLYHQGNESSKNSHTQ